MEVRQNSLLLYRVGALLCLSVCCTCGGPLSPLTFLTQMSVWGRSPRISIISATTIRFSPALPLTRTASLSAHCILPSDETGAPRLQFFFLRRRRPYLVQVYKTTTTEKKEEEATAAGDGWLLIPGLGGNLTGHSRFRDKKESGEENYVEVCVCAVLRVRFCRSQ